MPYLCFVVSSICSPGAYLSSNGEMEAAESSIAPSQTRGAPSPLPLFLPGQLLAHAVSQSESVTACVGSFSAEREGERKRS